MNPSPALPLSVPVPVPVLNPLPINRLQVPPARRLASNEEWLPFTIEVVNSVESMQAAVAVRQAAYARHLPEFSARLAEPEAADLEPGVTVLLARSKLDGEPLGSMRIQTNTLAALPLESSVDLPAPLRDAHLAEATRLGVTQAQVGRLVKTALFKAFYMHSMSMDIEYMVVTARSPLDRQYQRLLFDEVFPERGPIPMRHVGNLPHRILSFELLKAEARWAEAKHPMLDFMCHTYHPDIHLPMGVVRRRQRGEALRA